MLPPGLISPSEVSHHYDRKYFQLIESGQADPFVYPLFTFGTAFALLYFLIDHRGSRGSRYVGFILYSIFQIWCVLRLAARNPAASYGNGIISSFSWLWVATHLIVNDGQAEYKRLERREQDAEERPESKRTGRVTDDGKEQPQLYWQSYPARFRQRIDWVVDMFISFRGVGWSYQTRGVPDPPSWAEAQLTGSGSMVQNDEITVSRTGIRRFSNRRQLVREALIQALLGYLALDALKTFTMHDPYFWGYTTAPSASIYPDLVRSSYVATRTIRLLTTMIYTSTALWTIFKLGPIFFAGVLGPRVIGLKGEAWMNPADMFGPLSNILDMGLGGFWSGFWHQVFRYVFEAPGTRLLDILKVKKKSAAGKLIGLAVAFTISGSIHACGSFTQLGDTRPIKGPFTFFLLQGAGIALEDLARDALKSTGVELPAAVKKVLNLSFALIWLYQTGPLMCDDFAQGGVWLFEPVPISLFRYLGFGVADARWLCWDSDFASWHAGKSWLTTGLSF